MPRHTVTAVALAGLLAASAAAYFLNQRTPPAAGAAAGKQEPPKSAATAGAPGKGPGGPAPVEVVQLKPVRVQESIAAVGSLRSNESVVLRPEVSGRVAAIGFRDGQAVKRGQLLVGEPLQVRRGRLRVGLYSRRHERPASQNTRRPRPRTYPG